MTQAAIGADFHQPFDIERDLLTKITLNGMLFLDDLTDLIHLIFVDRSVCRTYVQLSELLGGGPQTVPAPVLIE